MLKNYKKRVLIVKKAITKKISVDLNILNYALNSKKKNNTIVTKVEKVILKRLQEMVNKLRMMVIYSK